MVSDKPLALGRNGLEGYRASGLFHQTEELVRLGELRPWESEIGRRGAAPHLSLKLEGETSSIFGKSVISSDGLLGHTRERSFS